MASRADQVLLEVDGAVATVTFSNVAKRNALSINMRRDLVSILHQLQDDPTVRVVVLTGDGEDAFVAGADLSEVGELRTVADVQQEGKLYETELRAAWDRLDKPVLAMIQGYCIGAGLLLALEADIRVAAESSQLGIPAARLGIGYGVVEPLTSVVGIPWASEMLFTGRRLSDVEALEIGLVNHVVPKAQLRGFTMDLAGEIARNAPLTIATVKVAIRQHRQASTARDQTRVDAMIEACLQSDDFKEGQAAFKERRSPRFTGA